MGTLGDLKNTLEQARQHGRLALTSGLIGVQNIGLFLDSLPSKRLTVNAPSPGDIRLSGSTFPQTLVVEGTSSERWPISGIGADAVPVDGVTLTLTQADATAVIEGKLELVGRLSISGKEVSVAGRLIQGERLRFETGGANGSTFSLEEILSYATFSSISTSLPSAAPLFQELRITALELIFGFALHTPTSLTLAVEALNDGTGWEFMAGSRIENIGAKIRAEHELLNSGNLGLTFSGSVFGRFAIGQEFDVVMGFQPGNFWELAIYPAEGNVLPSLSELAYFAGGQSLQDSVQEGFARLGLEAFSIKAVNLGFQLSPPRVTYVSMLGQMQIGDVGFDIRALIPDFRFSGNLSAGSKISMKSIAQRYFSGADTMPEIDVTALSLSAYPSLGNYDFKIEITDDWVFDFGPGSFTINQLEIDIEKDSRGFSGSISGSLRISDLSVFIQATRPEPGCGWVFSGSGASQDFPIGKLIAEISQQFNVELPAFVNSISLETLAVTFDTQSKNFKFTCGGMFPVADAEVDIRLEIELQNMSAAGGQQWIQRGDTAVYDKRLSGYIKVRLDDDETHDLTFTLVLDKTEVGASFAASYVGRESVNVKRLISALSAEVGELIPESLELELDDIYFIVSQLSGQTQPSTRFIFGLDIGGDINLSNLPLVGSQFQYDQTVSVDDLQIVMASQPFDQQEIDSFHKLLRDGATSLPANSVEKGVSFFARMNFGGASEILGLPVTSNGYASSTVTQSAAANASSSTVTSDNAKWFTLQKSFGPVTFNRVGVQYQDQTLWFLLDAALSLAGLKLGLDGLAVGSPLSKFEPKFNLRGLGIDYSNGPVEIGGAFLKTQVQVGGKTYDEYDGAAIIKATQFTLSAVGSYADLDGHPSLFIYAVLDYPLGGPAFFFVTGLAAGFGYNRSLLMPAIDQVAQFPLVAQAINGQRSPNNLTTELQSLQQYIPPAVGETFLAVGVKFTSFKIIDSFVLLTVAFGTRFEVNLLGLSTLISPPQAPSNVPPLAVVQMAVRAAFFPDEGFLGVQAQLTPASYIFTRDCHLTGGFAFYSWFSGAHAGEFVITLGGYHPNFNVPDYFPKVPRLGVSWQVNSNLSVKGGVYYALTASALMAGGSLQATWQDGNLKAWFNAGADFIVSWKPYHYDAYIRVNMSVSYTFTVNLVAFKVSKTISVDVGADLRIWGPEFSGKAHINLDVVSFDVTFGSAASQQPQPISWADFRNSFLPGDNEVCGIAIRTGLTQTTEAKQWVVNPKDFCLVTDSVIPSKTALAGASQLQFSEPLVTDFGVGPMAVAPANLSTKHNIQINRMVNGVGVSAETNFDFIPIKKRVPAGLWGKTLTPSVNGQGYIEQALSGFEIKPKNPPAPGMTSDIDIGVLQCDPTNVQNAFYWETFKSFNASSESDDVRRESIRAGLMRTETIAARNRLLQDLGLSVNLTLSESTADAFSVPPQVGSFAG